MNFFVQVLSIGLDPCHCGGKLNVLVVETHILSIKIFDSLLRALNLTNYIVKNFSQLIEFIQCFHEIGLDIVTFVDKVLFIHIGNIELATNIGILMMFESHLLFQVFILDSPTLQFILHALV